ncbi:Anaerobic sulfite reductase subunit A [Chitinispirillum alkaliphilum]|nr:Anaerobic sulfite reductase subunit A [Chitinispirillum alkaliphilum]
MEYEENQNVGERRRVWDGCHLDGFTDMAGGHSFRVKKNERIIKRDLVPICVLGVWAM